MYNTLYFLDYTAELIELAYELGAATRKYVVPAVVAVYVATIIAYEYVHKLLPPNRSRMIQDLIREFEAISLIDPITNGSDVPEAILVFESMSTKELREEWESI